MMNSIAISKEDRLLLYRYLGQGTCDKKIIILGNEPGLAGVNDLPDMILKIRNGSVTKGYEIGKHVPFQLSESFSHPTTSEFARFGSRLELAVTYNDPRFIGELSEQGKIAINNHIFKPISEKNSSLLNLRPLPRPTQDTWIYSNINRKEYNKEWNFGLKRHNMTPEGMERVEGIVRFIQNVTDGIILGVGEKENKKLFFKKFFPNDEFWKINLDSHSIYYNSKRKIILSDYFNSRNGIKLQGLKELYDFLISRKLIW